MDFAKLLSILSENGLEMRVVPYKYHYTIRLTRVTGIGAPSQLHIQEVLDKNLVECANFEALQVIIDKMVETLKAAGPCANANQS